MEEVAKFCSVRYVENDDGTDEVYVTFKVVDEKYKKLVLQLGRRDDIEMHISGEKLYLKEKK